MATSMRPTAPAAPHTTASLALSGQTRASPPAVRLATARHAASSKLRPSGIGTSMEAGATTKVAHDPRTAAQHTRVATEIDAPGPAATTTPDPSPPSGNGKGSRTVYLPERINVSAWLRPAAS